MGVYVVCAECVCGGGKGVLNLEYTRTIERCMFVKKGGGGGGGGGGNGKKGRGCGHSVYVCMCKW